MRRPARPTLRCLSVDLKLPLPTAAERLDELDHPLLFKARQQFDDSDTSHERIRSIDDQVLFKVKAQRWRGAVWTEPTLPWLVAAGRREAGSPEDFYASLAKSGEAARARHNLAHKPALATRTHTAGLLPDRDDRLRILLEEGLTFVRRLEHIIPGMVRRSLRDGGEYCVAFAAFAVSVQVRADSGHETYVAIAIYGSVHTNLTKIVLDIVPGCDRTAWFPEAAFPDRDLRPNEQAWSNVMDPLVAAKLLDND